MKYIDADKMIAEIERLKEETPIGICEYDKGEENGRMEVLMSLQSTIDSLKQEQPKGNLEYWLEHFGMPKENIDNCITQIAQGYGACRYLEGVQHGAEAVNELAKQEQPKVDLEKEIDNFLNETGAPYVWCNDDEQKEWCEIIARHFYELGLNARKEIEKESLADSK